ncbi:MAG: cell envelope integrity protein CreD [Lentisphaerae bacterium]|nr:cell envelope integrity protein CreD [Lentisphaerota bacterium]
MSNPSPELPPDAVRAANYEPSPLAKKWSVKITIIVAALLLLQIPVMMIKSLTREREKHQLEATGAIAKAWGRAQTIGTIQLNGRKPETLTVKTTFSPEVRYFGIYQSVVYTSQSVITAGFNQGGKQLIMHISDLKGLQDISAELNGQKLSYTAGGSDSTLVFTVPEDVPAPAVFTCKLKLRGTDGFTVAASAGHNDISFSGSWGAPNFGESGTLPDTREITEKSFTAGWQINNILNNGSEPEKAQVKFYIPAGTYQQVERTVTYAAFFLAVFFFTLVCGEFLSKTEIHPAQYVVASGAPVLFYMMLLAVGEKCGFTAGYMISAGVIVLMVGGYAGMFFSKWLPATILAAVFAFSYAVNFIILQMEDFALISGTVILAIILGIVMAFTGKINRCTGE